MSRPPTIASPVPALRCNDLLFLNEYFRNGQNATQAYRVVHPKAKYASAEVSAHRLLLKPKIQREIALRMRYQVGVTKEWGESRLLQYEQMALDKGDYAAGASIVMDAMKLGGFVTEKREVKTLTDSEHSAIRDLVKSSLPQTTTGSN